MLLGIPVYVLMVCSGEHILKKEYIFYNYFIIVVTTVVVFLAFRKITWTINIVVTFYVILFLVNELLLQFRGSFFLPSDIFSVKTAFSVSGNYVSDMDMSSSILRLVFSLGAIYVFTNKYGRLQYKEQMRKKCYFFYAKILVILCVGILGIKITSLNEFYLNMFHTKNTVNKIGYIGFSYMQLENLFVDKPKGYEATEMQEYLEEQGEIMYEDELPNIIVIMNESFADFSQFGRLPITKDALPFIHGLEENAKKGNVYVSVWGGNTCNTEYEFLTGNTMKFCPDTVPYMQFLKDETYSIAKFLKKIGYDTQGIHPYYKTGYRRNVVYHLMGIDKFYSGSLFDEAYEIMKFNSRMTVETLNEKPKGLYIRELISDKATYSKIVEMYEEREDTDKPLFTFCVTMQKHSPYTYKGKYEKSIVFETDDGSKETVTQYLSMIHESDHAFEELIQYFQKKMKKPLY